MTKYQLFIRRSYIGLTGCFIPHVIAMHSQMPLVKTNLKMGEKGILFKLRTNLNYRIVLKYAFIVFM